MAITVVEVRTGAVKGYGGPGQGSWRSAIGKEPVSGPVFLGRMGLSGDKVGNLLVHGGPDQAVLAYAGEHYPLWQAEGLEAEPGSFGENFVLNGLTDAQACIGDEYALGGARLQISHPRQPCDTLARRFGSREVIARVWSTCRGGWYMRVLEEGPVEAGMALTLLARPNPEGTVARVLAAYLNAVANPAETLAMAGLAGLTPSWAIRMGKKTGA